MKQGVNLKRGGMSVQTILIIVAAAVLLVSMVVYATARGDISGLIEKIFSSLR